MFTDHPERFHSERACYLHVTGLQCACVFACLSAHLYLCLFFVFSLVRAGQERQEGGHTGVKAAYESQNWLSSSLNPLLNSQHVNMARLSTPHHLRHPQSQALAPLWGTGCLISPPGKMKRGRWGLALCLLALGFVLLPHKQAHVHKYMTAYTHEHKHRQRWANSMRHTPGKCKDKACRNYSSINTAHQHLYGVTWLIFKK